MMRGLGVTSQIDLDHLDGVGVRTTRGGLNSHLQYRSAPVPMPRAHWESNYMAAVIATDVVAVSVAVLLGAILGLRRLFRRGAPNRRDGRDERDDRDEARA